MSSARWLALSSYTVLMLITDANSVLYNLREMFNMLVYGFCFSAFIFTSQGNFLHRCSLRRELIPLPFISITSSSTKLNYMIQLLQVLCKTLTKGEIFLFIHSFIHRQSNHNTFNFHIVPYPSQPLVWAFALFTAMSISTQMSISTLHGSGLLLIHLSIGSVCRTPTQDQRARGHQNLLLLLV